MIRHEAKMALGERAFLTKKDARPPRRRVLEAKKAPAPTVVARVTGLPFFTDGGKETAAEQVASRMMDDFLKKNLAGLLRDKHLRETLDQTVRARYESITTGVPERMAREVRDLDGKRHEGPEAEALATKLFQNLALYEGREDRRRDILDGTVMMLTTLVAHEKLHPDIALELLSNTITTHSERPHGLNVKALLAVTRAFIATPVPTANKTKKETPPKTVTALPMQQRTVTDLSESFGRLIAQVRTVSQPAADTINQSFKRTLKRLIDTIVVTYKTKYSSRSIVEALSQLLEYVLHHPGHSQAQITKAGYNRAHFRQLIDDQVLTSTPGKTK